jgi:hypothetical protein
VTWEDHIKMHLKETWCKSVDWTHLAQNRSCDGCYEHSNEPPGFIKGGEFLGQLSNYQPFKMNYAS